jgi:hypothetical protein
MCTVTWSFHRDGYDLLMNRDELHTRGPAIAPRHHTVDGVNFLAPIDSDARGTWIAANELGVTVGLLNRYPSSYSDKEGVRYSSRGKLILALAGARSAEDAVRRIEAHALSTYRPFTFFAIDTSGILTVVWDGTGEPYREEAIIPLSSSSFRGDEVVAERVALFEQQVTAVKSRPGELIAPDRLPVRRLRQYHASYNPRRGAHSVCMDRPDAATKSFSHVSVDRRAVRFLYHDGPPCEDSADTVDMLTREPAG